MKTSNAIRRRCGVSATVAPSINVPMYLSTEKLAEKLLLAVSTFVGFFFKNRNGQHQTFI